MKTWWGKSINELTLYELQSALILESQRLCSKEFGGIPTWEGKPLDKMALSELKLALNEVCRLNDPSSPPPEETTAMNLSTAVFLINKDVRAVLTVYEGDEEAFRPNGAAKRKMFKTLDAGIKKDDYVVVATGTRHGMTVVKVTDVDVSVDFEDKTPVEWVIQRVDCVKHEQIVKDELLAVEVIKKAEFRKRRDALRNDLVAADEEEFKSLPMYKNDTTPAKTIG